jgi:hypothetical protein
MLSMSEFRSQIQHVDPLADARAWLARMEQTLARLAAECAPEREKDQQFGDRRQIAGRLVQDLRDAGYSCGLVDDGRARALSTTIEGTIAGKSAADLETMIMERLRENPACAALARVQVVPEGDEGGWGAHAQPRMGMIILDECTRSISAVVTDLRRGHRLVEK